jgi:hypothetical protein
VDTKKENILISIQEKVINIVEPYIMSFAINDQDTISEINFLIKQEIDKMLIGTPYKWEVKVEQGICDPRVLNTVFSSDFIDWYTNGQIERYL